LNREKERLLRKGKSLDREEKGKISKTIPLQGKLSEQKEKKGEKLRKKRER
jgi:hypothetical protein